MAICNVNRLPCTIRISAYRRKRKGKVHSVRSHTRRFTKTSWEAAKRNARKKRKK
jgi:hypothetical protein